MRLCMYLSPSKNLYSQKKKPKYMGKVYSHTYRLKANARRNETKTNPMPASNKSSRDERTKKKVDVKQKSGSEYCQCIAEYKEKGKWNFETNG